MRHSSAGAARVLRLAVCVAATGAAAQGVSLPLEDDFEALNFPRWRVVTVEGSNALEPSMEAAWSGAQSMRVFYAGDPKADAAFVSADFAAGTTRVFARFGLLVPAVTAAAVPTGSRLRLLRLGDAPGESGNPRASLYLNKHAGGRVYLTLVYRSSAEVYVTLGDEAITPLAAGAWQPVELQWDPPAVRLYVGDASTPRIDAQPADLPVIELWRVGLGLVNETDAAGPGVAWYLDGFALSDTSSPGVPPGVDGGSSDAGGGGTGGLPAAKLLVGCACGQGGDAAAGLAWLAAHALLLRAKGGRGPGGRARRSGSRR